MKTPGLIKRTVIGLVVAVAIGGAGLPALAHADEGKGLTGKNAPVHAPVSHDTYELETVQFTFDKIS